MHRPRLSRVAPTLFCTAWHRRRAPTDVRRAGRAPAGTCLALNTAPDAACPFAVAASHSRPTTRSSSSRPTGAGRRPGDRARWAPPRRPRSVAPSRSWGDPLRTSASHPALTPSASAWPSCTDSPPGRSASVVVYDSPLGGPADGPGPGDLHAITLHEGDDRLRRSAGLAGGDGLRARVDLVGRRGEFAVRGGILDVFPTTPPTTVCIGVLRRRDHRHPRVLRRRPAHHPEIDASPVVIHACRELLLTAPVRARAGRLLESQDEGSDLTSMLANSPRVSPSKWGWRRSSRSLPTTISNSSPKSSPTARSCCCWTRRRSARVRDLAATRRFLDAAWTVAAMGGDAPVDVENAVGPLRGFAASALSAHRRRGGGDAGLGSPVVDVGPLSSGEADEVALAVTAGPAPRGNDDEIVALFAQLRPRQRRWARGDRRRGQGHGRAHRRTLGWRPKSRRRWPPWSAAVPDAVTIHGTLRRGLVTSGSAATTPPLVVVTEADLTGTRVAGTRATVAGSVPKRRNQVDPLALTAGDLVVHDQHGIGRFVEMIERTVSGRAANTSSSSTPRASAASPATSCTCRWTCSTSFPAMSVAKHRRCRNWAARIGRTPSAKPARLCARSPANLSSSTPPAMPLRGTPSPRTARGSARWRTPSTSPRRRTS